MKGSCNCKKIKFEINDKPISEILSFEKERQRQSGSDRVFDVWAKKTQLNILEGNVTTHTHESTTHAFCAHCGCTVYSEKQGNAHVSIPVNTLDNSEKLSPNAAAFTKDAPDWSLIPSNIPTFNHEPNMKEYKRKTRLKFFVVYPIVFLITAVFFAYVVLKMGG